MWFTGNNKVVVNSHVVVSLCVLTEERRPRLGVQRTCGDDNTTTGELLEWGSSVLSISTDNQQKASAILLKEVG